MKGIIYLHIQDGELIYKVDHDAKTVKLVYYDGNEYDVIPKGAKEAYSEVFSIKYEYPNYKDVTPANQNPFNSDSDYHDQLKKKADEDAIATDGLESDGQPDEEKEWSDLEGPELLSEE